MKNSTVQAKLMALSNAYEFIRGHGEEGGIDENTFDEFTLAEYLNQCKVVSNMIERKRQQVLKANGYKEL